MTRKQKIVLKFIKIARKNPNNKLYLNFNAFKILANNKDWNWDYECSKCDWIINYIELPKAVRFKTIKKHFKEYINKVCFYDEFFNKAKYLIKRYKQGCYENGWM